MVQVKSIQSRDTTTFMLVAREPEGATVGGGGGNSFLALLDLLPQNSVRRTLTLCSTQQVKRLSGRGAGVGEKTKEKKKRSELVLLVEWMRIKMP